MRKPISELPVDATAAPHGHESPAEEQWLSQLDSALAASNGREVAVALFALDPLAEEFPLAEQSVLTERARAAFRFHLSQQPNAERPTPLPGEAIGWVLPGHTVDQALARANSTRMALSELELQLAGGAPVRPTFSGGVVVSPRDGATAAALWASARAALARASASGGNCVVPLPPCVMVPGGCVEIIDALKSLASREEFRMVIAAVNDELMTLCSSVRPHVVVYDAAAGKATLAEVARAAAASAGTRVVLATRSSPDPRFAKLAASIPGAQLVMGAAGFSDRLSNAVAIAVGVAPRRRIAPQKLIPLRLELLERKRFFRSALLDISESGARFTVDEGLTVGEPVRLEFAAPEQLFELLAHVVRTAALPNGGFEVGARFVAPSSEALVKIRQLIAATGATSPLTSTSPTEAAPVALTGPTFVLTNVEQRYAGAVALTDVSFSISNGERVAIIGPSGAGKSTLLQILNTAVAPSAGTVRVLGNDVATLEGRGLQRLRSRLGTVHQQLHLVPQASVFQNVLAGRLGKTSLFGALKALLSSEEADRAAAVLDEVGLSQKIYERLDRLSGGEQQRVAIARVLYQEPDVIIADEPLASIDPTRAAELVDLLLRITRGRTLIVTTHLLEPVLPYFSRVLGVRRGRVLFDRQRSDVTLDDLAGLYESDRVARAESGRRALSPAQRIPQHGTVMVGASATPGEFIMPRLVTSFVAEFPDVRVDLIVKGSREITSALLDGRLDLGFVGGQVPHPELSFEPFLDDEVILVAAANYRGLPEGPLPPSLVSRLSRVDREVGSATRSVVEDHFANLGAPLDPAAARMQVGSLSALKAAVEAGLGVAFVSRLTVEPELAAGILKQVAIHNVKIPRRVYVVQGRNRELPPGARRFLEVARRLVVTGGD